MGLDLTSLDFAMKELYTDQTVEDLTYKNRPLLALLPKEEDFYGRYFPVPLVYGNPQGRSANFTRAQTRGQATSTKGVEFLLRRVKDYGIAYIDNETMEASENDKGAFLKGAQTEIDGVINALSNSVASTLYRTGFGAIGRVGSASFATTTITLANINDVVNFEVGMELCLAAAEGTGDTRAYGSSGNGLIVTGVNRNTGVLTFGFNVNNATNGIPDIAQSDFIFVRGDRDESGTIAARKMSGLGAWVPESDPSSTAFFGVDRSVDVTRLGGLRLDTTLTGAPIEEALIDAQMRVFREGGNLDYFFMSVDRFAQLEKALGAKREYVDVQANANIGFRGLRVVGPNNDMTVLPDPWCPDSNGFGITRKTWAIKTLKKLIRPMSKAGEGKFQMIDQATADGVEVRMGYYGNVWCNAPGRNINVKFA